MSATNRGSERKICDFYSTPKDVVMKILKEINLNAYGNKILENSAGNGIVISCVNKLYPNKHITAIELREEEKQNLLNVADKVIIDDFLKINITDKYDIIIGNPPYSKAIEFVEKSLSLLSEHGILIYLLRTAFLESKTRYNFWQRNHLTGLYTLSKRPSFTGKGTDATSYSWFVWDKSDSQQHIKVI